METAEEATAIAGRPSQPFWQRYDLMMAIYAGVTIALLAAIHLPFATDYVGGDNDDVMRLVEVRDLLNGQGWFDLTQYRLGLESGTLMHWSRLVDLPIAVLIAFFDMFADRTTAEAIALTIWPLLLVLPLMAAMGLAGLRAGGASVMHIALGLTALAVASSNRFLPGSIDHHNVQMVLIAVIAAMLVDPRHQPSSLALAGLAAAVAIAIGAETMPLIAAACAVVAVTWAVVGPVYAHAARSFAASLGISISALFVATVPPHLYAVVTCDSLSIGYFSLVSVGGVLLFLSTIVAGSRGPAVRFAILGVDATLMVAMAALVAPKCLRSPLADLDPMLASLWLQNVGEAQSVLDKLRIEPWLVGGFYAVGLFGILVCIYRLLRREQMVMHASILPLLAVAWFVALVQVRGAPFSNMLSIIPLSLLIAQLRANARRAPKDSRAALAFLATVLISVPTFWFVGGAMATKGAAGLASRSSVATENGPAGDCASETALAELRDQPATTVAASSDSGAEILRFTGHRVLTAPYHRNQTGMLAEFHIGLAKSGEAVAVLRSANVGLVAFCLGDGQTRRLAEKEPGGLYAALARGVVPPYLRPLPTTGNSGLQLFRVDLPRE